MDPVELLRDLSTCAGVSGYEDRVRERVRVAFEPHVESLSGDALGNVIGYRPGRVAAGGVRRAIMLAAHTDEIGMMVTGFDGGFIRFTRVGGIDLRLILGQEVVVHGRRDFPGVVASRPPHVLPPEARREVVPLDKLFVDIGMSAERVREVVRVGDTITMRPEFRELAGGCVAGKAFDDRAGVVTLAVCLDLLSRMEHTWDVYAVGTSQEEVGLRGALTSAYGVAPDVAIAVDVGFGKQKGVAEADGGCPLDGGPAIAMGPNIHPLMYERLTKTAGELEMPYTLEVAAGGTGTDAWAIQVAREGIPTALLSLPLRYMHSTVETVHTKDIVRIGRLMAHFVVGLDDAFVSEMGL